MTYEVTITAADGPPQPFQVELLRDKQTDAIVCRVNGEPVAGLDARSTQREILSLILGANSYDVRRDSTESQQRIVIGEESFAYEVRDPRSLGARRAKAAAHEGPKKIKAPMPGLVVAVPQLQAAVVQPGQFLYYQFSIPSTTCAVTGRIVGLAGGNKDFQALVMDENSFLNWKTNHQAQAYWQSGQVAATNIGVRLSGPATYYLVISNVFSPVTAKTVKVQAYNLKGELYEMTCTDLPARVWQHEIDHLHGVLFIDKMGPLGRMGSKKDLEKFIAEFEEAKKKGTLPPDLEPKF